MSSRRLPAVLLLLFSSAVVLAAQTIPNWAAPSTWTPPPGSAGKRAFGDVSNPLPFIGVTPCRVFDTRTTSPIAGGTQRDFQVTGVCGIPSGASVVSFNFTVVNNFGGGFLTVFPAGTTRPTVSTLNWGPSTGTIANAAIVPLGNAGKITAFIGVTTSDLIADVNGYYSETPALTSDPFQVINASHYAISGQTTGAGVNDAGVFGLASSTTGITDGVWGQSNSNSDFAAGVLAINTATTGVTFGLFGRTNSATSGATGVYGEAVAAGGNTIYGVYGVSASFFTTSAGVKGLGNYAGVRGEGGIIGVLGIVTDSSVGSGVEGLKYSGTSQIASGKLAFTSGTDYGVYASVGTIGCNACTKQFVDPHPTDASKTIHYVSLEGPEAGTYFRGTARTVHGYAAIEVPDHFRWVTQEEGMTVQLTPVGELATMAVVSQDLNRIVVRSSRDVSFHYLIQGIRPAHKNFQPVMPGSEYAPRMPEDRMPEAWPSLIRQRLIENGTYNSDGTVNMETAERLGWTKIWADREARAKSAALEAQRATSPR